MSQKVTNQHQLYHHHGLKIVKSPFGIPLIPLLSLIAMITSSVGSLGVALFVGQRLSRNDKTLIPFLGGLVVFLTNLLGLGIVFLWKFGIEKPIAVS
jgi:hypothetical protein